MLTWKWVLGAAAALLLMRLGGLISNFWTALGVLGFLVILALLQTLPAFRRFATAIFVGWVAISFAIPMLFVAFRMDWPILGAALTRRSLDSELRAAEWFDPVGLRARLGLHRYCQEVDRLQGEWLDQQLQAVRRTLEPPRPGLLSRIGVALGLVRVPQWGFPTPPATVEKQKIADWLKTIEAHRLECRPLVLQARAKPPAPSEEKGWLERAYGAFTDNPRLIIFATVLALLAVTVLLIVVRLFQGKSFGGLAVAAALLFVVWLIADRALAGAALPGLAAAPPAVARPSPTAVPGFPLEYASPHRVAGSRAPRPAGPTSVVNKAEGAWEVAIDGSNGFGHLPLAAGHLTGIRLNPGERAAVRHLGGTIAYNTHGDRVDLCGTHRTVYEWEKFRFPEGLYGVFVGWRQVAGAAFGLQRSQCSRERMIIRAPEGQGVVELMFWFNTNELYKTPDGQTHTDGYAYAGWDGERARFEVSLQ